MSDGIADNSEDSPWLLELMNSAELGCDLKALAKRIVRAAEERHKRADDMTVAIARVRKIE